jgi:hypothetical protein
MPLLSLTIYFEKFLYFTTYKIYYENIFHGESKNTKSYVMIIYDF